MLFWDPDPKAFTVPFIQLDIYWYSLFFGAGFFAAYFLVLKDIQARLTVTQANMATDLRKKSALQYTDKLALYIFFGVLLGARLGHVFFYDWGYFSRHLGEIFALPLRGLASHGAVFGTFAALAIFYKLTPRLLTFRELLDSLARASTVIACTIRIGNFMNQEILGTATSLPWAITFGHPADMMYEPCHPVQLYEAIFYLAVGFVLYRLRKQLPDGASFGLLCVLIFGFRFCIEYLKLPQATHDGEGLHMGQLLSIPLIILGVYFLYTSYRSRTRR